MPGKMTFALRRFAGSESGATAIEYGLIGVLIAVVLVGALTSIGTQVAAMFAKVTAGF